MRNWRGKLTSKSSYELTDAPLYCVLTRVQLRHVWSLPIMFGWQIRVNRDARHVQHLIRYSLLMENWRTFFILSIWEDDDSMLEFLTHSTSHLRAARRALKHVARSNGKTGAPVIWSTEWYLRAVSRNLSWGDPRDWMQLQEYLSGSDCENENQAAALRGLEESGEQSVMDSPEQRRDDLTASSRMREAQPDRPNLIHEAATIA